MTEAHIRRTARAVGRYASAVADHTATRHTQYAHVVAAAPLSVELTDTDLVLDEDNLVLSQHVRWYDAIQGIDVGDSVAVTLMHDGDWLVSDIITETNPPTGLGVSGPAGGVLSGTYPNPSFAASPTFSGTLTASTLAASTLAVTTLSGNPNFSGYPTLTTSPVSSDDSTKLATTAFVQGLLASTPPHGSAGGALTGTYPNPSLADGVVTDAKVATPNKDGIATVPSMRTLGNASNQAMPGNATPGGPPTGTASGVLSGTYPGPGFAGSPTFTGTLTVPTAAITTLSGAPVLSASPATTDNTTKVATTAFTQALIAGRAPVTAGILYLSDYPRLGGETDDTARLGRAVTAAQAAYSYGWELRFPYGTVTVASFPSLLGAMDFTWRGVGGTGSGGGTASSIVYTGAGTRAIDFRQTVGARLVDLDVQYTNASFTGTLVDFRGSAVSGGAISAHGSIEGCSLTGTGSGSISGANELVALANCLGMTLDRVLLNGAVCGVRGADTTADFCNGNVLKDVRTGNTSQAPIQDFSGEGNTIINPIAEPLISGAAGWYKTTLGGSRGLTVEGGWWGDSTASGSWVDYTGVGLSMSGGTMNSGATQIKLGANTSGVSITGMVMAGHSGGTTTAFQVGTGCDHVTLWPNRIEGMAATLAYASGAKTPPNSILPDSGGNAAVRFAGGLVASGVSVPTQGQGIEFGTSGGVGFMQANDRTAGTSLPLHFSGSHVALYDQSANERLRIDGTGFGAFGVTPVARPLATADIKAALASLGWLRTGSASPLDLEGGAMNAGSYKVAGTALAASDLSNGVTGTGAVVLAASPTLSGTATVATLAATTFSGTPNFSGAATGQTATAGDSSTKLATTAFVDQATTPWRHFIDVFMSPALNTNYGTVGANVSTGVAGQTFYHYGGYRLSAGTVNAEVGWDVMLGAGTWKLQLIHETATNRGIYTVRIDGVDTSATIDGYASPGVMNVISETSTFTVSTTGKKRVSLKMATKNASSSAYYGTISAVNLVRTA